MVIWPTLLAAWIAVGSIGPPGRPAATASLPLLACAPALAFGVVCTVRGLHRAPAVCLLLAAVWLEVAGDVHPNDLATLLALLIPWWTGLALFRGESRIFRLGAWLAVAFCVHRLWFTGSRGALLATLLGLVAGLMLVRRPSRRTVITIAVLGLVALSWGFRDAGPVADSIDGARDAARNWLRDHDAEGATWQNLASGRPALWRQAAYVTSDFPLFGVGPGGYASLVPDVYPLPVRRVDLLQRHGPGSWRAADSHSLYLETAVAFGLPALLIFAVLCLQSLAGLVRSAGDPGAASAARAGAFGGLLAFLLHGLGDCAAPGSAVYAVSWIALGYGLGSRSGRAASDGDRARWRAPGARALVLLALLVLAALVVHLAMRLPAERQHRAAARAVLAGEGDDGVSALLDPGCADAWWRDRLAPTPSTAAELAVCAPDRLPDLRWLTPLDAERAAAAHAARPDHPDALLWRLWNLDPVTEHDDLVSGYLRYLAMRPGDAQARMELLARAGDDWRHRHPHLVLAFLAHACAHGDPGANACLGAGAMAQRLGLGDAVADSFYLASEWPGARQKASTESPQDLETMDEKDRIDKKARPRRLPH